jgi:hypothetical protein
VDTSDSEEGAASIFNVEVTHASYCLLTTYPFLRRSVSDAYLTYLPERAFGGMVESLKFAISVRPRVVIDSVECG